VAVEWSFWQWLPSKCYDAWQLRWREIDTEVEAEGESGLPINLFGLQWCDAVLSKPISASASVSQWFLYTSWL
jgi:hypothetical protein